MYNNEFVRICTNGKNYGLSNKFLKIVVDKCIEYRIFSRY